MILLAPTMVTTAARTNRRPAPQRPMRTRAAGSEAGAATSIAERAYRELRHRILNNLMPAGTHALEQDLAADFGISRTPLREALLRLASEGLVEVRPRHGMRVLPVSVDDMREIYEILTELESAAARRSAERGLSAAAVAELEQAVADMDAALAADDLDAWAEADGRFHKGLAAASGNRRLQAVVNHYLDQAHRVRMVTLRIRPRPATSNQDHAAVVDAIRRRDPETAERVHREHRLRNGRMLIELLERHRLTAL